MGAIIVERRKYLDEFYIYMSYFLKFDGFAAILGMKISKTPGPRYVCFAQPSWVPQNICPAMALTCTRKITLEENEAI